MASVLLTSSSHSYTEVVEVDVKELLLETPIQILYQMAVKNIIVRSDT